MRLRVWAITGAIAMGAALALTGLGSAATAARPSVRAGSFLSVWPACACGQSTVLEQFALADGRPLRALTRLPAGTGVTVSGPHVPRPGADVWVTLSSGPRCSGNVAGCGPVPGSCTSQVLRYAPGTGRLTPVLAFPSGTLVSDAVPDPQGRRVALVTGGCTTSFFNQHVVVRDLATGRQWSIGADAAPCHALSEVAWSRDGHRLVFPYGPSVLSRHTRFIPQGMCSTPRLSRLTIVSATRGSSSRSWRLIPAGPRCSYLAATFDRGGVAAIEGCAGWAYMVQLDRRNRVIRRLRLAPGYDGGGIATDWRTGTVLISETQTSHPPLFDWVWSLHGGRLRVVHRYPGRDAISVIAEPW